MTTVPLTRAPENDYVPGHALFRENVPGDFFGQKGVYKLHKHALTL